MERYRPLLLVLFWGLILEIIVMIYFLIQKRFSFEFYLNLIVMLVNIIGIALIIRALVRDITQKNR